jgi:hypothetical protein
MRDIQAEWRLEELFGQSEREESIALEQISE